MARYFLNKTVDDIKIYNTLYPKSILALERIVTHYKVLVQKMRDNSNEQTLKLQSILNRFLQLYYIGDFHNIKINHKFLEELDQKVKLQIE